MSEDLNNIQTLETSFIVNRDTEPCAPPLFEFGTSHGAYINIQLFVPRKGIYSAQHKGKKVVLKPQPTWEVNNVDLGAHLILHEATMLEQCAGKGVAPVIDLFTYNGKQILVTPYLGNGRFELIRTESQRSHAFTKTAQTIARIHDDCDTAHIDIKSDNIILFENESITIDFGLSRTDGAPAPSFFLEDHIVGTPHSLAPENFHGIYDKRTDIFQFALLWTRNTLKQEPFGVYRHDDRHVIDSSKIRYQREWFSPYGKLGDAIYKALSTDPSERPNMRDISHLLTQHPILNPQQNAHSSTPYRPTWFSSPRQ